MVGEKEEVVRGVWRSSPLCVPLQGMVETIYLDEGELISAGVDGFVRVGTGHRLQVVLFMEELGVCIFSTGVGL